MLWKKIIIVDKSDTIIWKKDKKLITPQDIYRVASLWIKNSQWDILLAQRSFSKKHHPGKWWPCVEGTLEFWTTYTSKIIKRTFEEIWLEIQEQNIIAWKKIYITYPYHHFNQTFQMKEAIDLDISDLQINLEEIASLKWWNKKELYQEINKNPDTFVTLLEQFIN